MLRVAKHRSSFGKHHHGRDSSLGQVGCQTMRGIAIALVTIAASTTLGGCGGSGTDDTATPTTTTAASDDIPRISPIPMTTPPTATAAPAPTRPVPAAGPGCDEAPAAIVDMINAAFTNGEHLENALSVPSPPGTVVVGGDIISPTGEKVSSADSWVMSGGAIYGLSSDARQHTLVPDGRDVIDDWTSYNDAIFECVLQSRRAANG